MNIRYTIGIVGNPNCGKSTLFNALTGARQHVGNWPGVTVEKKTGEYIFAHRTVQMIDLPGTYSLEASDDQVSLDEKVARDFVASKQADLIINIIDASNIERNLYLTSQLIEMRVPMLIVLNMMDVVRQRGLKIDHQLLAEKLACPVVNISAATGEGVKHLYKVIDQACQHPSIPQQEISYCPALEKAITSLQLLFQPKLEQYDCDSRWLAVRALEDDTLAKQRLGQQFVEPIKALQQQVETEAEDEIDILAADARYGFVNQLTRQTICRLNEVSRQLSDQIDQIVLNRFLGIPIFLLVMYTMFMFTINIGSAFVDFFDIAVRAIAVDGLAKLLTAMACPDWLVVLIANGAGGGVQVVATFIPIVGFLFVFLSALEDSGYMSRAAFVMDRFMLLIGLPGKSFVPMIIGFGCNVPAIMATRTLDNQQDRILTNLMNPFMSCGARLPVYALFAAAFFPVGGQNLVFGLYLLGIAVAVMTGLIMRHTLFKGEVTPFIMELPAYHMPTIKGVWLKTWEKLKTFIFNAGKVIVPMVLVLNVLNATSIEGDFGQENSQQSVLSEIGRTLTPAFKPMGIEADNWPATVGIFTGVLAKEAVVGTLNALYSQMLTHQAEKAVTEFNLLQRLSEACASVPENLLAVADNLLDPLGLDMGDLSDLDAVAAEQSVTTDTYAAMRSRFDGQISAFAYLLFILLYAPCVAATTAIYRETSATWALFVVSWTTGLAYMTAVIFYQAMTYNQHPDEAFSWIAGLVTAFILVLVGLWLYGRSFKVIKQSTGQHHDII